MPQNGYFDVPFGTSGPLATVPDTVQSDGSVSYAGGYGVNYTLNPATNPSALNVENTKMNQIFYDITSAIQYIQQNGAAPFITSSMNGGTPYSYTFGAMCSYNPGNGLQNWWSNATANTTTPGATGANWVPVGYNTPSFIVASAVGGTANSITATIPGYIVGSGYGFSLVATGTNTGATQITPNGGSPITVLKAVPTGLVALTGGEIQTGQPVTFIDNGSNLIITNPAVTNKNPIVAWGAFAGGSSGVAPTLVGGAGIANITRISTGLYGITLNSGVSVDTNYGVLATVTEYGTFVSGNGITIQYEIVSNTYVEIATNSFSTGSGFVAQDIGNLTLQILHA